MKKRILRIVILVIVVAAVSGIWWQKRSVPCTTDGCLRLYGTIDIRDASLAFIEQERIAQVLVEEGDPVKKGQVLAKLRTDRLAAQIQEVLGRIAAQQAVIRRLEAGSRPQEIRQARAQVASAKADEKNADLHFRRIEQIAGVGATSIQDLDNAKSRLAMTRANLKVAENALALVLEGPRQEDIASAKSTLEALNASLALMNVRLADMTLRAPAAGTIQSRILEPGEMAGPTKPVVILALTDPKWARVYVPEPALGRIAPGMVAKVTSDSFPDEAVDGRIGFISPTAEFTPKPVQTEELRTKLVYEVRVMVKDPANRLRLGMPVTVTVEEKQ